jgi:hypothetical protein
MPIQGTPATQPKKVTTVEFAQGAYQASAAFIGAWHDSQTDGVNFVTATFFASQAQSGASFSIQETDDTSNANFTRTVATLSGAYGANALERVQATIKARFWRVILTFGGTAGTIEITSCATNVQLLPSTNDSVAFDLPVAITVNEPGATIADNATQSITIPNVSGAGTALAVQDSFYGGAFSGTANAALQGWSKARTPTVFKRVTATATGSTAIWTPGTGNKFRLLAYRIQVTADATLAAAGRLTISLLDSATDIAQDLVAAVPAAGLTVGDDYDSGWTQLGYFGILSAAANNVLNVNLSAALTAGLVNVLVAGTEE